MAVQRTQRPVLNTKTPVSPILDGEVINCKYTYLSEHPESAYFHGNGYGHCLISMWFMEISTPIFLAEI